MCKIQNVGKKCICTVYVMVHTLKYCAKKSSTTVLRAFLFLLQVCQAWTNVLNMDRSVKLFCSWVLLMTQPLRLLGNNSGNLSTSSVLKEAKTILPVKYIAQNSEASFSRVSEFQFMSPFWTQVWHELGRK